eukprot:GHRR01026148.1.p1 GENE.GHRR01026148.1~~GHRR01026148.1.p1  ORF type:complete len:112 (+),score=16.75 GHRR01026148.1:162-497(+)
MQGANVKAGATSPATQAHRYAHCRNARRRPHVAKKQQASHVCCATSVTEQFPAQVCVVLGTQWGDEGKGKLVDILAQQYDVIARAQARNPSLSSCWSDCYCLTTKQMAKLQ